MQTIGAYLSNPWVITVIGGLFGNILSIIIVKLAKRTYPYIKSMFFNLIRGSWFKKSTEHLHNQRLEEITYNNKPSIFRFGIILTKIIGWAILFIIIFIVLVLFLIIPTVGPILCITHILNSFGVTQEIIVRTNVIFVIAEFSVAFFLIFIFPALKGNFKKS